jgi:hypothetical protein
MLHSITNFSCFCLYLLILEIVEKKKRTMKIDLESLKKKTNKTNPDTEDDEKNIEWEIPRIWMNRKYFRRSDVITKQLKKGVPLTAIEMGNHRKAVGDEGELLIVWNDGRREWSYLCTAYIDNKNLCLQYLKANNLTVKQMCKGLFLKRKNAEKLALTEARKLARKTLVEEREKAKAQKKQTNKPMELDAVPNDIMTNQDVPDVSIPDRDVVIPNQDATDVAEPNLVAIEDVVVVNNEQFTTSNKNTSVASKDIPVSSPRFVDCGNLKRHQYMYLHISDSSAYCKKNFRFHGQQCQACTNEFVEKIDKDEKAIKPSRKNPMHVCETSNCTYGVCHACHIKNYS